MIKVIQIGLGPIGQRITSYLAESDRFALVGAADIDPAKAGQDAGRLAGSRELGVVITADAEEVLSKEADVVILTTGSRLAAVELQIASCIKAGKAVISTCEELAFPFATHPEIARRLDDLARQHGVAVLGTGVNPGFLMDALPLFLTSVCRSVQAVRVERFQDASIRRLPFQKKIGAGLSPAEFAEGVQAGRIRHVGFRESVHMIAWALGWEIQRYEERVEPVVTQKAVASPFVKVKAGQCAGLRQVAHGQVDDRRSITLELQAYLGHPDPRDTVIIHGEPEIRSEVKGGVNGDIATCSVTLNAIESVLVAPPGLRTMLDVPLVHWRGA